MNIVSVNNLVKYYNEKKALDHISFVVKKGEILGLLGPNGAGKSTIINILSSVLKADEGSVHILNHNLDSNEMYIKEQIGVVPQDLAIYEEISAEKNVRFFASLYHISGKVLEEKVRKSLEIVGLYERRKDKPKTYSGGMKRRLNIACAIAHEPQLIIMDEPTVGIDPQSRNHILQCIKALQQRGSTVIYSTHYMEEVEAIADRIIIINEGAVIAEGTKEELNGLISDTITYNFTVVNIERLNVDAIKNIQGVTEINVSNSSVKIIVGKNQDKLNELISAIISSGCRIENMNSQEASLETVFLELTGRNLKD